MSKIRKTFIDNKVFFIVLAVLIIDLFRYIPTVEKLHDWCTTPYALTYNLGFGSRLLMGSIIHLFFNYLTSENLHFFILIFNILLVILTSYLLNFVAKKSDKNITFSIIALIAIYIFSPASVSYLFYWGNFGRLDLYLLLITIFQIIIFIKLRNRTIQLYIFPITVLIAIAIHQAYIFSFFPIIFILLIYNLIDNEFDNRSKSLLILTITATFVSFLVFQLVPFNSIYKTTDEVIHIISKTNSIPINEEMIEYEYFRKFSENVDKWVIVNVPFRIIKGLTVIIMLLPLNLLILKIWDLMFVNSKNQKNKIILFAIYLTPIYILPLFVLTVDWGRWFAAFYIVQFTIIFVLSYLKFEPMTLALENLQIYFIKHKYQIVIFVIYLASLGKFEALNQLESANAVLRSIGSIFIK